MGLKQTSDDTVVGPIAVGNGPRGLAVTRDGACVYVANLLQQHAVGDPDE